MISSIPPLVCHRLWHTATRRAVGDLAVRRAIDSLAIDTAVNRVGSRGSINLGLEVPGSIPASLLRNSNLALTTIFALTRRLGSGTAKVAGDKELDEEVGERSEVEDVQPDGKGLALGVNARNNLFLVDNLLGGGELEDRVSFSCWDLVADDTGGGGISHLGRNTEDKLLKVVQEGRSVGGGGGSCVGSGRSGGRGNRCGGLDNRGRNRHGVADEGVNHGIRGADQELRDLHAGQGALDNHGHLDREHTQCIVGIL